jgi:murein DD-endopeptidase MepM/ murein hydrolase activator NlpD
MMRAVTAADARRFGGIRVHTGRCAVAVLAMVSAGSWTSAAPQHREDVTVTLSGRARQPGEVMRLSASCECQAANARATAFGHDVPLVRVGNQWEGLIGIDLDAVPGSHAIAVRVEPQSGPAISATHTLVVKAKQFPIRHLTVAPQFVDPPESEVQRIQDEARTLARIYDNTATPRQWSGSFELPVAARANSSFGTRSVFNGEARSPHSGADFPAPTGTPVTAPAGGVVTLAASQYFTGNTIVIDHGLGLYSVLAHLSTMSVRVGDHVTAGQHVGLVGATGRVTGPHLHWSVRLNGARVDPLSLIAATTQP